jgi:hypothetical protein
MNARTGLVVGLAVAGVAVTLLLPPVWQDAAYHQFADNRTILGVPNFWNVVSNVPFLLVALWGFTALWRRGAFQDRWERWAYAILLAGLASVACGSGYYHWNPNDQTLFFDRLPMTIVFKSMLAITMGERLNPKAGPILLAPLLVLGVASLVVWRVTGDLRAYGLVQFYPMLAVPMMLILFPARYTGTAGIWAMVGLYGVAKVLELADHSIWSFAAPFSGHPWKHLAGAAAMLSYVEAVRRRQPVEETCSETTGSRILALQRGAQQ